MASKLSALKNCWICSYAWAQKTKDIKDSLLKTEDVLVKTKDGSTFFLWEGQG